MCLDINDQVQPGFDADGWGTFYKVLAADWEGPWYPGTAYKVGEVTVSDRRAGAPDGADRRQRTDMERRWNEVHEGIHVLLRRIDAENLVRQMDTPSFFEPKRPLRVVAVRAHRAHRDQLVAAGLFRLCESAVFLSVTVKEELPRVPDPQ